MTTLDIYVRWSIQRDLEDIALICQDSRGLFRQKTTDATQFRFLTELRKRTVIGIVAEDRKTDAILGYLIYRLYPDHVHVLDIAVSRDYRRLGVAKALLSKVESINRPRFTAYIPEDREEACELLHNAGWTGVAYDDLELWAFEKGRG